MAIQLAPTDPERALQYAEESILQGFPTEIQEVFAALLAIDAQYAHRLFEKAVPLYIADSSSNVFDALLLAYYLRNVPQPVADRELVVRFLATALARLEQVGDPSKPLGDGVRSAIFIVLRQLYPIYEQYDAGLTARVWEFSRRLAPDLRPSDLQTERLFPIEPEQNTAEAILTRATREPEGEDRDALYYKASLIYSDEKEFDRALAAARLASDSETRVAFLTYLRRLQAESAIADGNLGEAAQLIGQIELPEERAAAVEFARAGSENDPILARAVLTQTRQSLESQSGSPEHARAFLGLAAAYSAIDTLEGFELMAAAIKAANRIPEFNQIESPSRLVHLGGASREAIRLRGIDGDFLEGIRRLAQADFQRAAQLADMFANELMRGLSLINVAAPILDHSQENADQKR